MNSHLSVMEPSAYIRLLYEAGDWPGLFLILGLPVVIGKSIYGMKRWSYAAFIACSCVVLLKNIAILHTTNSDQMISLAMCLGNISLVTYFLIPAVRAPFLDARLRWWETDKRYCVALNSRLDHDSKNAIESVPCQIRDISLGGAFISMPAGCVLPESEMIRIRFSPNNRHILSVRSKVVFHRSLNGEAEGYGLQFIETTGATLSMIREVIRGLENSGCPSRNPDLTAWQDFMAWTHNLLNTGHGLLPQKSCVKPRPIGFPIDSSPEMSRENSMKPAV